MTAADQENVWISTSAELLRVSGRRAAMDGGVMIVMWLKHHLAIPQLGIEWLCCADLPVQPLGEL